MIYIVENWAAIVAATVGGLLLGLAWLRLSGFPLPSFGASLVAVLGSFWLAAILAGALILAPPEVRAQAGAWTIALGTPIIIWCGFLLPGFAATLPMLGMSWRRVAGVAGYWLAAMVLQGGILQAIGLTAPPV